MVEKTKELTPQEALRIRGLDRATPYVCPYPNCGVYALHHWGEVANLFLSLGNGVSTGRSIGDESSVVLSLCEHCHQEVMFVDELMVWPRSSSAPAANSDMPADVAADFNEARQIYQASPRGAAALLRLALQKLLPQIGATKNGINEAIGELVEAGTIPQRVQQALDAVRVIGNEAVHPGELDLRDDAQTVLTLFNLLNFIVEKAIAEPKEIDAIYGGLPSTKLKGIEVRDGKK
jgi:hypothetical protein